MLFIVAMLFGCSLKPESATVDSASAATGQNTAPQSVPDIQNVPSEPTVIENEPIIRIDDSFCEIRSYDIDGKTYVNINDFSAYFSLIRVDSNKSEDGRLNIITSPSLSEARIDPIIYRDITEMAESISDKSEEIGEPLKPVKIHMGALLFSYVLNTEHPEEQLDICARQLEDIGFQRVPTFDESGAEIAGEDAVYEKDDSRVTLSVFRISMSPDWFDFYIRLEQILDKRVSNEDAP
jgi:hypothetical protein